ncbi:MAG: erythronate-4-phosphate dehydrogenase [Gammaproteobacteria bacterium]
MNIVADDRIPLAKEAFAALGKIRLLPGREIGQSDLENCDCLIVRTVTRVDEDLLKNSPVKFVGTATIGMDHIDQAYLKKEKIGFSNAAGCNAEAASEYVISGLFAIAQKKSINLFNKKIGIVGYGNVGKRLADKLRALGINYVINDPPRQQAGLLDEHSVDLDTLIESVDVISLHVPLTRSGQHSTFHLFDAKNLAKLRPNTIFINAARGEIVNNAALEALLTTREDLSVFLDTWENEPLISESLLQMVTLGTPHIAGYSVEGRLRGTQMMLDAVAAHFDLQPDWNMENNLPKNQIIQSDLSEQNEFYWHSMFKLHFDIWRDHKALQAYSQQPKESRARYFDSLRRNYPDRIEYDNTDIFGISQKKAASIARQLLFNLND